MATTILIIEDDISIQRGLKDTLVFEGYEVETSLNGREGLELALKLKIDLLLLDIMLPGLNGYEICKRLKEKKPELPIIMLTARGAELDKVIGLDFGADDYITKPFSIPELLARIRAALRRIEELTNISDTYSFGKIKLDFKKYQAFNEKEEINLSSKEFAILRYLIAHEGEVIHRHELLDKVWGYDVIPTTRTVDNYILELRKKLEENPSEPKHLISIRGVGYKFLK